MSPDEFWELSQDEINIKISAYLEERETKIALDLQLANLIAMAFHDPKKMPKLEKLLPKKAANKIKEIKKQEVDAVAKQIGMRPPG